MWREASDRGRRRCTASAGGSSAAHGHSTFWNPQLLPLPPAPATWRPTPLAQSTPPFEPVLEVQAVQLATMPNTDEDGYDPQKEKKGKKDTGPPFNFTDRMLYELMYEVNTVW